MAARVRIGLLLVVAAAIVFDAVIALDRWVASGRATSAAAMRSANGHNAARAPTLAAARRELAASAQPLAALHDEASNLVGGGVRARLAQLRGWPVVINEWASWCYPCRSEFSMFATAGARFGRRVAFLGLDVADAPSDAKRFLASHPVSYPSYIDADGRMAQSLAPLEGLPTTLFLDAQGKVTFVHAGVYRGDALEADVSRYSLGGRG